MGYRERAILSAWGVGGVPVRMQDLLGGKDIVGSREQCVRRQGQEPQGGDEQQPEVGLALGLC